MIAANAELRTSFPDEPCGESDERHVVHESEVDRDVRSRRVSASVKASQSTPTSTFMAVVCALRPWPSVEKSAKGSSRAFTGQKSFRRSKVGGHLDALHPRRLRL